MTGLFQNNPILRVLIPFIVGILLYNSEITLLYICITFLLGIISYAIASHKRKSGNYNNSYFFIGFTLIIISLSWINSWLLSPPPLEYEYNNSSKIFTRIEEITDNEASIKVIGTIIGETDSLNHEIKDSPQQKILLIIQGSNYHLHEGDVIAYYPQISPIQNFGNPDEFDYRQFMADKGIFRTQFIQENGYIKVGIDNTIFTEVTKLRRKITNCILQSSLAPESQQFLITILLGDKRFLSQEVKTDFSRVGLSHILALSGLHIGIISIILFFLLFPLDYLGCKKIKIIILIVILSLYALLTGLSPSVTRAVIMFIFASLAFILYRGNSVFNAICGAALLILCLSPNSLSNVGFQLSFMAVISIILFSGHLNPISRKHPKIYYISTLVSISVSAMIGTGFISIYYFHSFPLLFIIPNILLIPILPILLSLGVLAVILPIDFLSNLFDYLFLQILKFTDYIGNLPYAYIESIDISIVELILYFSAVAMLYLWFISHKAKFMMISIGFLIALNFSCLISYFTPKGEGFIIFNDHKSVPILYHANGKAYFAPTVDSLYLENFKAFNSNFMAKRGIKNIEIVKDTLLNGNTIISTDYCYALNKKIAIIHRSFKRNIVPSQQLDVDYLILMPSYYGSIRRLITFYNPKTIIIPGCTFSRRAKGLEIECQKEKLKYIYLKDSGAFILE